MKALVTGCGNPEGVAAAVVPALAAAGWSCVETGLADLDLADPSAATALFDRAGEVDALVCLHTRSERGGVLDAGVEEELSRHFAVNVLGTFRLVREFVRRWRGGPGGRIVLFTSGSPLRGELAYAVSKRGLEGLALSVAAEVAASGITVNCVDPGPVDTGWMSGDVRSWVEGESPLRTAGKGADVAGLVVWLCSRAADRMTGQILRCDGGWSSLR